MVVLEGGFSSWARMTQLPDGSWLSAYMYATTPTRIRIKRSFDNMRNWQFITEIVEDGRDLDNPSLCLLPSGAIELALRSVQGTASYYIEVYRSDDAGNSFHYQSRVDQGKIPQGVFEPHLFILPDGTLACFYANENHEYEAVSYSQTLSERVSSDGGNTWGPEILAVAEPGNSRPGTGNLVMLPGNVLALFYEVCLTEDCRGHVSYSPDGLTWPGTIGNLVNSTYQDVEALAMTNGLILVTSNYRDIMVSADFTNSWIDSGAFIAPFGKWPGIYQTGLNEFAVALAGAGPDGEAGLYIRFGTINPGAFSVSAPADVCKGPTRDRVQDCW
jgi:hypothetical protein